METLEDFNSTLQYHPGTANVVVDALSGKAQCVLSGLVVSKWKMYDYISEFNLILTYVILVHVFYFGSSANNIS